MYLAPLNYDRFFKKVFSDPEIAQKFLEDFLDVEIEEIQILNDKHRITDDASIVEFDFRCKIKGAYVIVDMQQWYKQDIGQRFYMYHALNTGLQLEKLPDKGGGMLIKKNKLKKIKDYRALEPVITLIWMVEDTLGFNENYVSFMMTPELVLDFVRDEKLWNNPNIIEILKKRTGVLEVVNNEKKGMSFIAANRLIFLLQGNIVKNKPHTRYERWFTFAEKSRNDENIEEDFQEYRGDKIFLEIIRRLNKTELKAEDITYIENEAEIWAEFKQFEQNIYDAGRDEGIKEVIKEGIKEGKKEMAKQMLSDNFPIETIVKYSGLTPDEIEKL
jgi:hypothetical protein